MGVTEVIGALLGLLARLATNPLDLEGVEEVESTEVEIHSHSRIVAPSLEALQDDTA